ncbi:MAG: hypothetical protein Q9207_005177 [Kuettlingeria erythrocarpa]
MSSSAPPPGGDDTERRATLIIVAIVFTVLAMITTTIRLTVRSLKHQFGWDDLAISLASVLDILKLVFGGLQYREGYGRHAYYLSTQQERNSLKWNYVTQYLIFLIVCLTKVGICLFVLRIKNTGWVKWCLYTLMAGLVLTTAPCIIILSAQCRPIRALWDRDAGSCWRFDIYNGAIWAQVGALEGNLGIIGANLAMSRAVYVFIRDRRNARGSPTGGGKRSYPPWSHPSWKRLRPTTNDAKSQDSAIALQEPIIRKTTDLVVTREPRKQQYGAADDTVSHDYTFFADDRV